MVHHIPLALELHIHLQPTPDGRFLRSLKPWYFTVPVLLPNLLAFLLCNFHHLGHLRKIVSFQAQLGSLFMGHPFARFRIGKPSTYAMTYDLPAVSITKRHRDAIKINLYQLHATLLRANWLYDDVT
eukprot:jgi/Psemu1/48320/gm1.48320_g